jgi:transposase-like protein
MYLAGVSVRRVEDITEALWGTRVSSGTVSRLNQKIYGKIEQWRMRPIEGEHPMVYLDGISMKRTWAGEVRNVSILVAIAVNQEGYREVLGVSEGAKEDKESWTNFLRYLKDRGLKGTRLFISDKCLGLIEVLPDFYPEARWQRCVVHWYRNVLTTVPRGKAKEVAAMLKAIHAHEDLEAAREKAKAVAREARGDAPWEGCSHRPRRCRGDPDVHGFPPGALDSDPHEQSFGANSQRGAKAYTGRRGIPGWAIGTHVGSRSPPSYCRHSLGN